LYTLMLVVEYNRDVAADAVVHGGGDDAVDAWYMHAALDMMVWVTLYAAVAVEVGIVDIAAVAVYCKLADNIVVAHMVMYDMGMIALLSSLALLADM
jgi:hypothetical protein